MQGRRRGISVLLTRGWVLAHIGLVVLVAAFLALAWWQVGRAADGNLLSYGYAFEWPAFAAFTVWVWVVEVRKALRAAAQAVPTPEDQPAAQPAPAPRRRARSQAAYDDSDDPQLAAYNHYLGWLNANPHRNPADYPGLPSVKESSQ